MNLFNPQALWLAMTIPAIVALYILRPRHKQKVVPSTLLWQQAATPRQATRPWQRLRPQVLLWLQLLAAALFSLAAAAPVWYFNQPSASTIVLLDTSASMQANDLGQTRLARAVSEIEAIALGLKKGARLTVIAFDRQPRVIVKDSNDYAEIRRALQELKPSSSGARLGPALSLARALARDQKNQPRLLLFSDGGAAGLDDYADLPETRLIGSPDAANVAIASLTLRPAGAGQAALAVLVNCGGRPASGKVELDAAGQGRGAKTFQLQPGKAASFLWSGLPPGATVSARLHLDDPQMDHFPLDNQAWAVPRQERKSRVLLVTKGNTFLEKMLGIFPQLEVYKATPDNYPSLLAGRYPYDLTVLDGMAKPLPPGAVFLIGPPPGEVAEGLVVGEVIQPGELLPEPGSPYLEYVDLSRVHVAAARRLELGGGWQKDVSAEESIVMAHGTTPGRRLAVLGFALADSDFPLRPAFPVLMQNVLAWLLPPGVGVPSQATLGEEVEITALPLAKKITVESPEGTVAPLAPPFPPPSWLPEKPGLYRITQTLPEGNTNVSRVVRFVAVNGYSVQESNIQVKDVPAGERKIAKGAAPRERPFPLAGGLTLVALFTLLVEWGVASRGR